LSDERFSIIKPPRSAGMASAAFASGIRNIFLRVNRNNLELYLYLQRTAASRPSAYSEIFVRMDETKPTWVNRVPRRSPHEAWIAQLRRLPNASSCVPIGAPVYFSYCFAIGEIHG
jgi:hypothetical protein